MSWTRIDDGDVKAIFYWWAERKGSSLLLTLINTVNYVIYLFFKFFVIFFKTRNSAYYAAYSA
ncbi:MAG: hypothetical protein B1H13_03825, partial [Desulfobacteraceae bacterium 4484_190.3]